MVAKLVLCAALFLGADGKDLKGSSAAKPAVTQPAATQPTAVRAAAPQAAVQPAAIPLAAQPPAKKKLELIAVEQVIVERTVNQTMQHTRQPVAENIAMGQPDGPSVVQCWMNSSGHRANILNWGHRRIGVAAYQTIQGTIFWCQQFR
jgi:uncharacterized protein YkwD